MRGLSSLYWLLADDGDRPSRLGRATADAEGALLGLAALLEVEVEEHRWRKAGTRRRHGSCSAASAPSWTISMQGSRPSGCLPRGNAAPPGALDGRAALVRGR
jgi:hypothetical protein